MNQFKDTAADQSNRIIAIFPNRLADVDDIALAIEAVDNVRNMVDDISTDLL
jgi:hypothetical protein